MRSLPGIILSSLLPLCRLIVTPGLISFTFELDPAAGTIPDPTMNRNDTVVLGTLSVVIVMFLLGVGFGLLLGC